MTPTPTPVPTPPNPPLSAWRWGFSHLMAKTPKLAKGIGRGLVGLATFASTSEFKAGHEKLAGLIFAAGCLGWFLSSMFTDDAAPVLTPPVEQPAIDPSNPMA